MTALVEGQADAETGLDPVIDERSSWSRIGPVKRTVIVLVGVVVAINATLAGLDLVVGSDPGGPSGSSFSTGDDGVAAWADLLAARGVAVDRLQTPLDEAALDPAMTLIVVDPPDPVDDGALRVVADHVARGGRLVAVGGGATDLVVASTGVDPGWSRGGPLRPQALTATPETAGVERLSAEGRGRYVTSSGFTPLLGGDGEVTAVARGPVVGVADPTPLWNRHLAEADDAAFALGLAGDGPVVFAEAEHGYGQSEGLAALPLSWRLAAAGLLVAALLAMWCAGQRLGPPERSERALAPPRGAYVDAMTAALSRAGARTHPDPGPNDPRPPPSGGPREP